MKDNIISLIQVKHILYSLKSVHNVFLIHLKKKKKLKIKILQRSFAVKLQSLFL